MNTYATCELKWLKNLDDIDRKPQFLHVGRPFWGHQRAKNGPIFLKIKSVLPLTPMSAYATCEPKWLKNIDDIDRKPHFYMSFLHFLATRGPKICGS